MTDFYPILVDSQNSQFESIFSIEDSINQVLPGEDYGISVYIANNWLPPVFLPFAGFS